MKTFIVILIGLAGGTASGLLGIGGAVIMIPALVLIAGFDQHTAQGTTLCAMVPPIGLLAAIEYYRAGYADIKIAVIISAAFIIGAYFGSKVAITISPYLLKKVFGFVLLAISIKIIVS